MEKLKEDRGGRRTISKKNYHQRVTKLDKKFNC